MCQTILDLIPMNTSTCIPIFTTKIPSYLNKTQCSNKIVLFLFIVCVAVILYIVYKNNNTDNIQTFDKLILITKLLGVIQLF